MEFSFTLWMQAWALFAGTIVVYMLFFKGKDKLGKSEGPYSETDWNFFIKKWLAYIKLTRRRKHAVYVADSFLPSFAEEELERPRKLTEEKNVDSLTVIGMDKSGNKIHLKLQRKRHNTVEVWLMVTLENGKNYQLPDHPNTVLRANTSADSWSGGGLKLQICEPLRRWRISFNGLLRSGICNSWNNDDNGDDLEHVQFGFIWSACSGPVDVQADWSLHLQSQALAHEYWRDGNWLDLVNHLGNGFEQWGMVCGSWTDAENKTKEMYLRGVRKRLWGIDEVEWQHRSITLFGVAANGLMFSLHASCNPEGLTHAVFGHIREANGQQFAIDWSDISLPDIGEFREEIPSHVVIRFTAKGQLYMAALDFQPQHETRLYGGQPWNHEVYVKPFQCGINSHQAVGVAEFWYRYAGEFPEEKLQSASSLDAPLFQEDLPLAALNAPLVVSFEETICQNTAVVGGKGASLARMVSFKGNQLNVPRGFCLTVSALELQLQQNSHIRKAIEELKDISCDLKTGDMKEQCDRIASLFKSTPICVAVSRQIVKYVSTLNVSRLLAVRSSGVGEDSEELSAAGQNTTLLGQRQADIVKAVSECWASLFTFQSVQYRRQHGQKVDCGMGVVVQEMVLAGSAGVLFTRHPVSGDPSKMLITANYGLGESVVSALVEPDTIILKRDWRNRMSIEETQCGSKAHQIEVQVEGGITTSSIDSEKTSQLCITEEEALALGQLGLQVEALFGGPRDIEWAIADKMYLLQARPITTLNSWTDFELMHEFDSAITSDEDVHTIANTGEVLPGAVSPLTNSWLIRGLDQSVRDSIHSNTGQNYYLTNIPVSHHHVMLNVLTTMLRAVEKRITIGNKVSDLAVYGHSVTTPELHRVAMERNGVMTGMRKMYELFTMTKESFQNGSKVKRAKEFSETFSLDLQSYTSAEQLYEKITSAYPSLLKVCSFHNHASRVSFFSQMVAMMILTEGKEDFTTDHVSDISLLLSSCSDVISADIPTALKELSILIVNSGLGSDFTNLAPEIALKWLESHSPNIATKLKEFLSKHEHRGIREFELMSITWGMNPKVVIETLQSMVDAADRNQNIRPPQNNSNQLPELQSTLKFGTKVALSWLMSWCKSSVSNREATKACLIKVVHQFRKAYLRLGQLLVNEGKLPEASLIFFFTHYELSLMLRCSDPSLLNKASRRRRLHPQWDQLQFPEISIGLPRPLAIEAPLPNDTSLAVRLQGTSVCIGTVMGRACVIHKLDEISQLKPNDILITHCTDIGWSPYFPLLSGVVTELGGLISHGAVVAREYGLPCIVGAVGATTVFKTGDTVLLMGSTGVLEKIVQE